MFSFKDRIRLLFVVYEAAQIYVRFRDAFHFMQNRPMLLVAFVVNVKEKHWKV